MSTLLTLLCYTGSSCRFVMFAYLDKWEFDKVLLAATSCRCFGMSVGRQIKGGGGAIFHGRIVCAVFTSQSFPTSMRSCWRYSLSRGTSKHVTKDHFHHNSRRPSLFNNYPPDQNLNTCTSSQHTLYIATPNPDYLRRRSPVPRSGRGGDGGGGTDSSGSGVNVAIVVPVVAVVVVTILIIVLVLVGRKWKRKGEPMYGR